MPGNGYKPEHAQHGGDRHGFVCPGCGFRPLLSDTDVAQKIMDCFKSGVQSFVMACPECGRESSYSRLDLKIFLPGGRQVVINRRGSKPQ